MRLIVAGVGPGDPGLIPLAALHAAEGADLILAPCSQDDKRSLAGDILRANFPNLTLMPLLFPMTRNPEERDGALRTQLQALRPQWENARTVMLPVIGDSALYATGAYLYDVWRELTPTLELTLIPGISAHSLAASLARRFLAMGPEIFCVIPCTAPQDRIEAALRASDAAALYKPAVLGDKLRETVTQSGPWREMVRVDRAGLPEESVLRGSEALNPVNDYLSLLLLWRGA